jgi:uncharacterized iron-regulated protein
MKIRAIAVILLFLPCLLKAQEPFQIFSGKGEKIRWTDVLHASKGKSHIFFGEQHNSAVAHWLQLELAKALFERDSSQLIIGAEMFEADNQLLIDEYLSGLISQKSFEEEARLWKNYKTDYKPILEFAKKNNIPVVATNVPRRYANAVYHGGIAVLSKLTPPALHFLPPLPMKIDTTQSSYQELLKMSASHSGSHMLEAQALKDAAMAHFIAQHSTDRSVFLHLNGSYHSDRYEGIVNFLQRLVPLKNMLVITTVTQKEIDRLEKKNEALADFIICR